MAALKVVSYDNLVQYDKLIKAEIDKRIDSGITSSVKSVSITENSDGTTVKLYTQESPKSADEPVGTFTIPTAFPAEKITGTIDLSHLPQGALERCVVVANDAARLALTTSNVQKGDTVKVTSSGVMYFVVDDTKLNSEDGYEVYTAGSATSVPWSGVTDKPDVYTPEDHTHSVEDITDFNIIAPKTAETAAVAYDNGLSVGDGAAAGFYSVAIGDKADATKNAVSVGYKTKSKGSYSLAIGNGASANTDSSIAIGDSSGSSGGIAIGVNAKSNGGVALGGISSAEGDNSVALGYSSVTTDSDGNAVSVGYDAVTGEDGTVTKKEYTRRIIHVGTPTNDSDAATKEYVDGMSPSIEVTEGENSHTVSITDKDGTKSFEVKDGVSDTRVVVELKDGNQSTIIDAACNATGDIGVTFEYDGDTYTGWANVVNVDESYEATLTGMAVSEGYLVAVNFRCYAVCAGGDNNFVELSVSKCAKDTIYVAHGSLRDGAVSVYGTTFASDIDSAIDNHKAIFMILDDNSGSKGITKLLRCDCATRISGTNNCYNLTFVGDGCTVECNTSEGTFTYTETSGNSGSSDGQLVTFYATYDSSTGSITADSDTMYDDLVAAYMADKDIRLVILDENSEDIFKLQNFNAYTQDSTTYYFGVFAGTDFETLEARYIGAGLNENNEFLIAYMSNDASSSTSIISPSTSSSSPNATNASIAIGNAGSGLPVSASDNSVFIGSYEGGASKQSVAIGLGAAAEEYSVAIGAIPSKNGTTYYGNGYTCAMNYSIAFGSFAQATTGAYSVALGVDSIADENYTVSVGLATRKVYTGSGASRTVTPFTRRITNVSDPVNDSDAATKKYVDEAIAAAVAAALLVNSEEDAS